MRGPNTNICRTVNSLLSVLLLRYDSFISDAERDRDGDMYVSKQDNDPLLFLIISEDATQFTGDRRPQI